MSGSRACFSGDRKYRYRLSRCVGESSHRLLFIMLNPSKADETHNDPTIRRCIGFARGWGERDSTSVFLLQEERAGVKVRSS